MLTAEQVETRKRWVDALRSGQYQQTQHKLRDAAGFCCLGVLCDVVEPQHWTVLPEKPAYQAHLGGTDMPSRETLEKVGMVAYDWQDASGGFLVAAALVEANDSGGYAFADIADLIEADTKARLEGVPV